MSTDNHWQYAAQHLAKRRKCVEHAFADQRATRAALQLCALPQGDNDLPMPWRTHVAEYVAAKLADLGMRKEARP